MVMKNPFANSDKRIKTMMGISIALAVALSSTGLFLTRQVDSFIQDFNYIMYQAIVIANIFACNVCVILVLIRFRKHGISNSIKNAISARYLEFVILFAIFEFPFTYWMKPHYRYIETHDTYVGGTKFIDSWYFWPVTLFGVIIALSRLRDPLLRVKLKDVWYVMTFRSHKRDRFNVFDKAVRRYQLNSFLKQSLTTELVLTILKGITILAASTSDNVDHMKADEAYKIKQTTTIELSEVKIAHAREFFINKKGESVDIEKKHEVKGKVIRASKTSAEIN